MLKRQGIRDTSRAAVWFVKWWRDEDGKLSASAPDITVLPFADGLEQRMSWGFDFEWTVRQTDIFAEGMIQKKLEERIDAYSEDMEKEEHDGDTLSSSQEKKSGKRAEAARRALKLKRKLAARGR